MGYQTAHTMFSDMPQGDHKKRAKYRFASKTLMRILPTGLKAEVEGLIEKDNHPRPVRDPRSVHMGTGSQGLNSTYLFSTALYCTVKYCTVLFYKLLYCTVL